MVKIIDCTVQDFINRIKNKELIAFGAGRIFKSFSEIFKLEGKIKYVVDNDENKIGTKVNINGVEVPIEDITKLNDLNINRNVILISTTFSVVSIIKQLDSLEVINGIECYIAPLILENIEAQEIVYPKRMQKIPKKLHYCWFGKKKMPDELKRYMESWEKYCCDYEIIKWDESNYDISKNKYMKQAYEHGKWGFVPDYARLDIIYEHGGIYLDTDVEIVKSFDDLLCSSSFLGFSGYGKVAMGLGFGAVKGNNLIYNLRKYYNDKEFIHSDGKLDLRTSDEYQVPVLKKMGYILNGKQQSISDNIIYPREVFNPLGNYGIHNLFTSDTHSIHHAQISWENDINKKYYFESNKYMNKRIQLEIADN